MRDVHDHGYHGAASLNSVDLGYCYKCRRKKHGNYVRMEKSEESTTDWKCPKCGSADVVKRGFTPKHLRNVQSKVFDKLTDFVNYNPLFLEIRDAYTRFLNDHPGAREDFQKSFSEYELQASKDLLCKRERWIITHSKSKMKSKCYIPVDRFADIGINDKRYFLYYKPAIAKIAESCGKAESERQFKQLCEAVSDKLPRFFEVSGKVLKELGWPEAFITDKVIYDITSALATRYIGSND